MTSTLICYEAERDFSKPWIKNFVNCTRGKMKSAFCFLFKIGLTWRAKQRLCSQESEKKVLERCAINLINKKYIYFCMFVVLVS